MSTRIALYPGSFDPVTFGHVDLIRRSLSVADQLVISILPNAAKEALLPLAERAALLRAVVASELTDLADRISIRTDADLAVRIAADAGFDDSYTVSPSSVSTSGGSSGASPAASCCEIAAPSSFFWAAMMMSPIHICQATKRRTTTPAVRSSSPST